MNAININSKFDGKCSNNSAAVGHWFVAKTSKYREHLLLVFILTLEATVLKVILIFLYQPVDNDNLVILNIIVSLVTCKSIVLVNFHKQKLNNSKNSGKTAR